MNHPSPATGQQPSRQCRATRPSAWPFMTMPATPRAGSTVPVPEPAPPLPGTTEAPDPTPRPDRPDPAVEDPPAPQDPGKPVREPGAPPPAQW